MKIFKCPDCKHVRHVKNNIKAVGCACGKGMEEVDSNHNPLTEEMKICDSHTCENCPIRGIKCFTV